MIDLRLGNCLEVMKTIKDNSIDAIITDPPYGTTACKWDSVIDFDLMWEQLNRIIKPNGAIVLFGSEPFSSALRMSNIENYRYDWKYKKKNAPNYPHAKNMPLKIVEDIIVFSNSKIGHKSQLKESRMEYNPQGLEDCNEVVNGKRGSTNEELYVRPSHKDFTRTKKGYPKNILEFNYDYSNQLHPTQKPVALMEYLIKTYTNEGELVLDFTMGSGTTGVACKNLGRDFVGLEMDDKYFKIAVERILDIQVDDLKDRYTEYYDNTLARQEIAKKHTEDIVAEKGLFG